MITLMDFIGEVSENGDYQQTHVMKKFPKATHRIYYWILKALTVVIHQGICKNIRNVSDESLIENEDMESSELN